MEGCFQPDKVARQIVHLPTSTSLTTGTEQNKRREDQGDIGGTRVDSNVMVQPQKSLDLLDHPYKARRVCNRGKQKLPYIGRLEAHLIDQRDR